MLEPIHMGSTNCMCLASSGLMEAFWALKEIAPKTARFHSVGKAVLQKTKRKSSVTCFCTLSIRNDAKRTPE